MAQQCRESGGKAGNKAMSDDGKTEKSMIFSQITVAEGALAGVMKLL